MKATCAFIFYLCLPSSTEDYIEESGRDGRDGLEPTPAVWAFLARVGKADAPGSGLKLVVSTEYMPGFS